MWTRFPTVILLIAFAAAHAQTEIAPDTWLISGATPPDAQPDGNTVIIDSMPGLIVFDTGRHAAHTQQILDFATRAHAPIKAIINSHWHLDHIGGNKLIRAAYPGVRIYARPVDQGTLKRSARPSGIDPPPRTHVPARRPHRRGRSSRDCL